MRNKCRVCGGLIGNSPLFPFGNPGDMCSDCCSYQQKKISELGREPSEEVKLKRREAYFKGVLNG